MTQSEILQILNACYITLKKIKQSPEWSELLNSEEVDHEAKTHLGDVLHYLSEAIGCVDVAMNMKLEEENARTNQSPNQSQIRI